MCCTVDFIITACALRVKFADQLDPCGWFGPVSRGRTLVRRRTMSYDEDDFDEFMARVNEVDTAIKGLASGEIMPDQIDDKEAQIQEMKEKEQRKKAAAKAAQQSEIDAKKKEASDKKKYIDEHYEELKDKVDAIHAERAMKEKARKRFGAWRQKHSKTLVCDYKGWDVWEPEEDEDDNIYKDCPPPDSPALRAMEADIVDRGKRKAEREKLADIEKEAGNRAFKAQQYSEAVRCYTVAIDNNKCDRVLYNNRAFAYVKMGSWASAIEDCDKVRTLSSIAAPLQHRIAI